MSPLAALAAPAALPPSPRAAVKFAPRPARIIPGAVAPRLRRLRHSWTRAADRKAPAPQMRARGAGPSAGGPRICVASAFGRLARRITRRAHLECALERQVGYCGNLKAAANSPRAAATQSARRIERGRAASLVSRCVTLKLNSAPWKCRDTRAAVSSSEVDPLQRARAFLLGDSPPSSVPHGRLQAAARFGRVAWDTSEPAQIARRTTRAVSK
ncbi:hypothetical protein B0H15DRAFT_450378 [Mycena belliarum]|uniref:Uncharacterized protein n=1 Tax=Mycena belliarum TaxID=1033014 RepID=A0AAD6TXA9_9AGAR|nr:hypothetical protein B0H15DRAFT_450378 [Mycena belliae]